MDSRGAGCRVGQYMPIPGTLCREYLGKLRVTCSFDDNDDDSETKSLAQIMADESGAYVLSTGGFAQDSFADYINSLKENRTSSPPRSERSLRYDLRRDDGVVVERLGATNHDFLPNTRKEAYESKDNVWYFTYPNRAPGYLSEVFQCILGTLDDIERQE